MPQSAASNLTPFTTETCVEYRAKALAVRQSEPRIHPKKQALNLQHALHKAGQTLGDDIADCEDKEQRARVASALASVAKGWQSMTDQLRIMSGKAAPGTLSPAERRAKAESKRSAPKRDGPRLPRPAAPSPAPQDSSKESTLGSDRGGTADPDPQLPGTDAS